MNFVISAHKALICCRSEQHLFEMDGYSHNHGPCTLWKETKEIEHFGGFLLLFLKTGVSAVRVTQVYSLVMCCRAPSIPEAQDLSRSSSNASSFASVVEEQEGEEEYDTGQVCGDKLREVNAL